MSDRWTIAWCHSASAGGSKRATYEMVRELSRRGHVIDEYIVADTGRNQDYLPLRPFVRESSATVLEVKPTELRPYLLETWMSLWTGLWRSVSARRCLHRLAQRLDTRAYDFVHVDHYPGCRAAWLVPPLRRPTVLFSHEPSRVRYREGRPCERSTGESWLRRRYGALCEYPLRALAVRRTRRDVVAVRRASVVFTNSEYSSELLHYEYGRGATVVHVGVNTETFRPLPESVEPMVLSVGRLVRAKEHHVVLDAMREVAVERRPRVIIATPETAGKGEDLDYERFLRDRAAAWGVILEIRHNPAQRELVRLYSRALAVVFVPRMEPFGLVALEAMACGTPVIGVDEGGLRESVVHGVTGWLMERDAGAIADKIELLSRNENLRREIGSAGVSHVRRHWTWAQAADDYEAHVRALLGHREPPSACSVGSDRDTGRHTSPSLRLPGEAAR